MWFKRKKTVESEKPRILIVEDDLNNQPLFFRVFSEAGFTVTLSRNADGDFVDEVANLAPDIISMDIMMGKSGAEVEREGIEAVALLKADERTKNIPVMMLTNFSTETKVIQAKEAGAVDFISLQGHSIREIPLIFLNYLENPAEYLPTHPLLRN